MHSAPEVLNQACASRAAAVWSSGAWLLPLSCSASVLGVVLALGATVESARAWRRSVWAALVDLERASIGERN
jgi:hypothetical protein